MVTIEELARMALKGPFLGIDWGKKRVGLAISDPGHSIAVPLYVWPKHSDRSVAYRLEKMQEEYRFCAIVLGWPLNLDGSESANCGKVLKFADVLAAWPVVLWDERLTTKGLRHLGVHPAEEEDVDHHAAAVILQNALDRWRYVMAQRAEQNA